MSGESAPKPKPRLVLCPKCWQLLPESPDYDVYKCGGCGTTLQAKKRRSKDVNSESSMHETDAAPRNAVDPKADDKQYNNEEKLLRYQENGVREKLISSSSGKCSLDGYDRRDQIENGECNGEQLVASQVNGFNEETTRSSSRECSSSENGGRDQIKDGEFNGKQLVTSPENGFGVKTSSSSSGESSLAGNGGRYLIEGGECDGEQPVISQENGFSEKAASSSSQECSLNGNVERNEIEDGKYNGEHPVISQTNGLGENAANSSSGESSLNRNGGRNQIEDGKYNGEQTVISQENGLMEKASGSSLGEFSLDENDGKDQIENGERNGEWIEHVNLSDETLENEMDMYKLSDMRSQSGCSDELTHFENDASAELVAVCSVENANTNLHLEGEELSNGNVPLEGAGEQLISALDKEDANDEKSDLQVNGNLILEGPEEELFCGSGEEGVNNDKLELFGANPKVVINGSREATSEELLDGNLLLEVTEEQLNGEDLKHLLSDLVGAKSEVDNAGNTSTAKRLSTEEGSISCAYPSELEEGSFSNHASSKTIAHSFDRVRSVDTFDNTEVMNPGFETSGTLGGFPKSSTTRSYHAYDGSVSSNDGVDDQFPNQYLDSFENTYAVSSGVFEGGSRKGKGIVNSMLHGDLETINRYFQEGRPYVQRDSMVNINEVPETTRHDHAHWMRTKRDEFPPRIPHHRSGSQSGYESGSTSNQIIDEFYCGSSYLSHDSYDDPDQEKMKLLRLVYKLQYQLNRTSYVSGETNGRSSMGSHMSAYQSHDLHERRFYHGLDYPRYDGINWCQKHNFSRAPYSTEPTCSIHHVDPSCFNCCPQQWQHSAELPPRDLYQHEELCRHNPGHSCCSAHHSYPVSPQWSMTSNLQAHAHETMSCDQMYRPEVKKHFREKPVLTRRHYRPVAGGAPFVTCNKCLKLLQLPADFLLFKRVFHQLKCGACQEVLKFSLHNRSHIVSYASNDVEPSLNEVIYGSNPPSEPRDNYHHSPHADHASYSDDYGNSAGKSYSSEGDPIPLNPLHGSEYDKPTVSSGTLETITEKEKTAVIGPGTGEASVETDKSNMNSSNFAPEIEAHFQPKSSPLHQLMGYSSPSQVVRGIP
ncbi:protein ENHANCED DISEASE RESISTANCE 4 [Vigna radiata var. radiata]|uniref:Protein ENHANCED DISEASE RESISTANCE 4 n=1 Tax=Vigna radiata var. radiata TaxID=3916 RepID=A0A1S3UFY6_VIGRR|nr:protein ENHANCED DISEASE RESISTANCE 4 [Vigna radiata var. radiata]